MENIKLPEWSLEVLKDLQKVDPLAHIAGGFVRDLDNGVEPKDIDIFLSVKDHAGFTNIMNDVGFAIQYAVASEYFEYEPTVVDSWEFVHEACVLGYWPVNIIRLTEPMALGQNLQRFDFGICRIGYDGDTVQVGEGYGTDRTNKTFTLLRAENDKQFERSMARYNRLEEKYAGWSLVVPAQFAEFKKRYDAANSFDGLDDDFKWPDEVL